MKPIYPILALLFLNYSSALSQANKVTLKSESKSDNAVEISYTKTDPGTYTVQVAFSTLDNGSFPALYHTVKSYSGRMLTITPVDKSRPINYQYYYSYIRGKLAPKYDPAFTYLLPYPEGTSMQIVETTFLPSMYFGEETPDDWNAYRYYTAEQTAVTAMRKGVVVEIVDEHDEPGGNVSYTSRVNSMTIEHEDGTLAYYKGFEKGSLNVKLGDTVFPATALGLNTQIDRDRDYYVSVTIQYLKTIVQDPATKRMARSGRFYGFVTPRFATAEGEGIVLQDQQLYRAVAPPAIVAAEMSRREKRRLEAGN